MGKIGSTETLPEDMVDAVLGTSWSLASAHVADPSGELSLRAVSRVAPVVSDSTPLERLPAKFEGDDSPAVVVVDDRQRPLGVVTPQYLFEAIHGRTTEELRVATALSAARSGGTFLPEVTKVRVAARGFVRDGRDFAVVVRDDGTLTGIVRALDILAALHRAKEDL